MNEEKIKQINKMTRAEANESTYFKVLHTFFEVEGSKNAISLKHINLGVDAEIIEAFAHRINELGILNVKGNFESGFYLPDRQDKLVELANINALDDKIFNYAIENLTSREAESFFNRILPFAQKQKVKTNFDKTAGKILKKLERKEKEELQEQERIIRQKNYKKMCEDLPPWIDINFKGEKSVNEPVLANELIKKYGVKCWNNKLRTLNGDIEDEKIKQVIQSYIEPYIIKKIAVITENILKVIKTKCYCEEPKPDRESIHFPNGTLKVDDKGLFTVFSEQKEFCRNRLATNYNFNAPEPKLFLKYLDDLYTPEQIVIIQQFLGYCLIPTNALGITVHIYGRADSGKSRLAFIMMNILGKQNAIMSKISKLGERFGGANVEGKLMYIDEDTSETALANTQVYKTLVTIGDNTPIDLEAKNKQKNIFIPYARFLTFGNFVIQSLYDHTQGFYRRMIILECKPAPKERKKIANLDSLIYKKEGEGVLKWCIDGLNQLIKNDWKLPLTDELIKHSNELKYESDSVKQFIEEDEHIIKNTPTAKIHTVDLYKGYERYCNNNGLKPVTIQTFTRNIKEYTENTDVKYSTNVVIDTKRARGFIGLSYFS